MTASLEDLQDAIIAAAAEIETQLQVIIDSENDDDAVNEAVNNIQNAMDALVAQTGKVPAPASPPPTTPTPPAPSAA